MKFLLLNFILLFNTYFVYNCFPYEIPLNDFVDNYKLSMISYCNKEHILNCGEMCDEMKQKKHINHSEIFYDNKLNILMWLFDTERDGIYLVFRGTQMNSMTNWIENLHISQDLYICLFSEKCCHNCKIHRGFLNMLEWVEEKLHESYYWQRYINSPVHHQKNINIIGHSLGGALASIVSVHYLHIYERNLNPDNIFVYTFGSPRVGNLAFSNFFDETIKNKFRVVNRYDIIPHLPPNIKFLDHFPEYIHVGNEYWINNNFIKLCTNTSNEYNEDFSCSFNAEKTLLSDHYYFFNLENQVKELFTYCL